MSDPAAEAAKHAWTGFAGGMFTRDDPEYLALLGVVQAALAPVRELHKRVPLHPMQDECENEHGDQHENDWTEDSSGEMICLACEPVYWVCAECWEVAGQDSEQEWPCATAKLIYPTEELG